MITNFKKFLKIKICNKFEMEFLEYLHILTRITE